MDSAHKHGWQTFEVVFGIPFLVAIVLQCIVPVSFPQGAIRIVPLLGGIGPIILGIVLVILTRQEFSRHGQHTDPGHPTSKIITRGVFSISRNPLYLGGICSLAGIGLAFDLPWVLIFLLPALAACHYILVAPEEKYLTARFGEEYARYTAAVHRWIGRAPDTPGR